MSHTTDRLRNDVPDAAPPLERREVMGLLVSAIATMMADWERDGVPPLGEATMLVADLSFQSLDIVVLMGVMSRRLDRTDIPFERLFFVGGRPAPDLSLSALTDFLWEHAARAPPGLV